MSHLSTARAKVGVRAGALAASLAMVLAACSSSPGALGRAESTGILAVGVVDSPVSTPTEGGGASGSQADLITDYAESIGARPTWQAGAGDALVGQLDRGEIDVVIGATGADGARMAAESDGHSILVKQDEEALATSIADFAG